MNETDQQGESTAEQAGIVDQQDAALEKMDNDGKVPEELREPEPTEDPNVGPMADDPMKGEAPSG